MVSHQLYTFTFVLHIPIFCKNWRRCHQHKHKKTEKKIKGTCNVNANDWCEPALKRKATIAKLINRNRNAFDRNLLTMPEPWICWYTTSELSYFFCRDYIPNLEDFFEEAIEQEDPEQMVEDQYKQVSSFVVFFFPKKTSKKNERKFVQLSLHSHCNSTALVIVIRNHNDNGYSHVRVFAYCYTHVALAKFVGPIFYTFNDNDCADQRSTCKCSPFKQKTGISHHAFCCMFSDNSANCVQCLNQLSYVL